MASKFQQRHFEVVASVLRERVEQAKNLANVSPWRMVAMEELARDFATKFRGDNPNFKRHVFMRAAGLPDAT